MHRSRIAIVLIRADSLGNIRLGSLSTKLNQTHFQGPAPRPLPGRGAGEVTLHALEARPFRSAGQAKRRAHLRRGSQLDGGSASGQPRGEQSPRSRPEYLPVRSGANQSDGVRNSGARRRAGSSPRKNSFAVSAVALVLGVPQLGHQLPGPGRSDPFSCCCASALSTDNALSPMSLRQQREVSGGAGGGHEPRGRRHGCRRPSHTRCRRHEAQKRCSSKATFLWST